MVSIEGNNKSFQVIFQNCNLTSSVQSTHIIQTTNIANGALASGPVRLQLVNTTIGNGATSGPLIDISGTTNLTTVSNCNFTQLLASPILQIGASAALGSISNSYFEIDKDATILNIYSPTIIGAPLITNTYFLAADTTNFPSPSLATSPLIILQGNVGNLTYQSAFTMRNCQLLSTSTAQQNLVQLNNTNNYIYMEKCIYGTNANSSSYNVYSTSSTNVLTYSANTSAATNITNYYGPTITANGYVLDVGSANPSTWSGPTGGFSSLAASAPGTLLATGSINQPHAGYVWANATVSAISTAGPGTMNAYIQIAEYTGPTMSYPYSSSGAAINYSLNYRTPSQIGPTGSIPIQLYGYDANAPTMNQINIFGLGNLS
jgi:hypothetical protein